MICNPSAKEKKQIHLLYSEFQTIEWLLKGKKGTSWDFSIC